MKKFKKSTAIVFSVILGILFVACILLSFVPMTAGANTFVSFSGSINISSDISGGMYGEYKIKTQNPSKSALISSMKKIKEVFEEDGYKNVNVYTVGDSKIRVEISYPKGSKSFSDAYSELTNVGSGAFSLRSKNDNSEETVILDGAKCVKEIKVYTNNATKYISIIFNEEGQKQYEKLCKATQTIYLYLGTYSQSISASNVTDYTSFTLSDTDYSNLVALEQKIKLGCMEVEVDGDTAVINTMSASLTAGESAGSPEFNTFNSSTAFIVAVSTIFVVIALGVAIFAVKFGFYSLMMIFTLVFNAFLFLALICLMPSIEIGLSGIAAIIIGLSLIYMFAYMFASRVKYEYNQGKSLSAALQTSYKKLFPSVLIENITIFASSLIFFACSFGELTSFAIIFAICSGLSIFTNILFVPFLIKICISFNGFGRKLFMLKKRNDILGSVEVGSEDISVSKEAE